VPNGRLTRWGGRDVRHPQGLHVLEARYTQSFTDVSDSAPDLTPGNTCKGNTTCVRRRDSLTGIAMEISAMDREVIVSLLHDIVNDQEGGRNVQELRRRFGNTFASIVGGSSDGSWCHAPPEQHREDVHLPFRP
jgi:hypothetical protein